MARIVINNGEDGLDVRNAINSMTQELYDSITVPIRMKNVQANAIQAIAGDTWVDKISVVGVAGAPVIRIGIIPNGQEILPDSPIGANFPPITAQQYFAADGNIYITFSAAGTILVRMDVILNYYNGN